MNSTINLSNGFLPLAPLLHADPTAVGVFDVERATVSWPAGEPCAGARDQLLLVRMHGEPLQIVHVERPPGPESVLDLPAALATEGQDRATTASPDPGAARPAGRAAVILCTVGRADLLARSLDSLTRMDCADVEIIVVDNRPGVGDTRGAVERLRSSANVPVRYVAEPRPGLAQARNAGVAAARDARFVAFTDDDVIVDRHWLAWLLAPFADPRVHATTGLVMPLSLSSAAQKRFEQYAGFGKGVRPEVYDLDANRAQARFLYPYWGGMFGSGNSMAFRRDALLAIGGFDPALGAGTGTAGGEDLAAFSDVILAGGRIAYEPRSLCWHEHRGDEAALRAQVLGYGIGLTAVLWRYLWRDWRFTAVLLRSLPAIARLARSRSDDRRDSRLPADLARLELRGRLLGPWRYMASSRSARSASVGDQAGAHTRT